MPDIRQIQRPSFDHGTSGSANEGPADSTDNASQAQSPAKKPKSSLLKRISTLFASKPGTNNAISEPLPAWRTFHPTHVGLHLTQDPHPETNANHRKLPEEHRADHEAAQKMAQAQQQHLLQPPPKLRGPVPRNRVGEDGYVASRSMAEHISEFRLSMDLDFLAPVERDVLHAMRRTRPSSHFRPLMNPAEEILLVHESDYGLVREIQDWIRPLPAKEKCTLAADLYDFLKEEKRYMLKLLLFHPTIRVTTKARGQGLGVEEAEGPEDRPQNVVSFAESVGSLNSGGPAKGRGSNETNTQKSSRINRAKTFGRTLDTVPKLRGGGTGTNSTRSSSSYVNFLRGSQHDRLDDDERVPSAMWWLAGGRGSSKGKQPTAGEMRERRRAEIHNREQVGFLGTLLGRRALKRASPVRREMDEYKSADDRQKMDTSQVDNTTAETEASEAPCPTATGLEKALPSESEPTSSVSDHADDQPQGNTSTQKSPALSIMSNVSNGEQAAQHPAIEETLADVDLNKDLQPHKNAVI